MNPKMRQKLILNKIKVQETVTTSELIKEFGVSTMTIRRDLQTLEELGHIELTHGGAIWKGDTILELPMSFKEDKFVDEKNAIARFCASLVSPKDVVFIETGTTTQAVANELTKKQKLTIYTNSLMAANTLSKFENIELYISPGKYRELSKGFVGPLTNEFMKKFAYDFVFIGTEGIDLEFGVSTPDLDDALAKNSAIKNAKNVILVADHNKFNHKFLCKICDLHNITQIVTDSNLDDEIYKEYLKQKIEIIRAKI